ncbi:MAG TPA: helix-hairpin-helix domain-containing protein [Geobacteraceae bacterium]
MSSWALRAVLLALVAFLFLPVFRKGRGNPHDGAAAFLRYTSGKVLVKAVGDVARVGVSQINDGMSIDDVIKMTIPGAQYTFTDQRGVGASMENGDILQFTRLADDNYRITLRIMTTPERMLFEIPLDPDRMGYDDWLSLPGIGPKLAETIVRDRQKNGNFGSLAMISRVPGVGAGRIEALVKYFK